MITPFKVAMLAAAIFASGAITGGLVSARLALGQARPAASHPGNAPNPGTSLPRPPSLGPSVSQSPSAENRRKERPGLRMPGGQRIEILRHLEESIPLDPRQRDRIRALVLESEQRIQREWEPAMPRVRSEIRELNRRIDAELRPDQRARLDALLGRRGNRRTNEVPASLR